MLLSHFTARSLSTLDATNLRHVYTGRRDVCICIVSLWLACTRESNTSYPDSHGVSDCILYHYMISAHRPACWLFLPRPQHRQCFSYQSLATTLCFRSFFSLKVRVLSVLARVTLMSTCFSEYVLKIAFFVASSAGTFTGLSMIFPYGLFYCIVNDILIPHSDIKVNAIDRLFLLGIVIVELFSAVIHPTVFGELVVVQAAISSLISRRIDAIPATDADVHLLRCGGSGFVDCVRDGHAGDPKCRKRRQSKIEIINKREKRNP